MNTRGPAVVSRALIGFLLLITSAVTCAASDWPDWTPCQRSCTYSRDNAAFDGCHCGYIADNADIAMQQASTPSIVIVDSFADVGERRGIEVRRAAITLFYLCNFRNVDPARIVLRWTR